MSTVEDLAAFRVATTQKSEAIDEEWEKHQALHLVSQLPHNEEVSRRILARANNLLDVWLYPPKPAV